MPHMLFTRCDNIRMGKRVPVPTEFSKRLNRLREEVYGWSKSKAARECTLSASLYGRYEAGAVEPTLSNILKLMKGFKVDFYTLIGDKKLNLLPSDEKRDNFA